MHIRHAAARLFAISRVARAQGAYLRPFVLPLVSRSIVALTSVTQGLGKKALLPTIGGGEGI